MENDKSSEQFIALKYNVPICESEVQEGLSSNELNIAGVAISETLTSNGHRFLGDELSEAASSLKGVVVLKDHENMVDNIVGRVTQSNYNVIDKNISFKAKIMDKDIKQMIKDGRLNTVSVGASVKTLEENDDGEMIPRGITFKELSVVAMPADPSASFSIGLKDSMNDKKVIKESVKSAMENYISESQSHLKEKPLKGGLIRMAENDETKEDTVSAPAEAEAPKAEAPAEAPAEESKDESKETETSESAFERGFKMAMKVKADDETVVPAEEAKPAEAPKEESKEEAKEEEAEEAPVETTEGFAVSKLTEGVRGNAMTLVRESY